VLVQGWSCFSPHFDGVSFVSYYIELPIMAVMYIGWKLLKKTKIVSLEEMDLVTDVYEGAGLRDYEEGKDDKGWKAKGKNIISWLF
jgi:AAT family amino acid transporter